MGQIFTDLSEITALADGDKVYYVDVSDTTVGPDGMGKYVTLETLRKFLVPVGTIQMLGGTSIPTGWLLCNGQAVSRTTYADLFAVAGVFFGSGDGSTTFNVPDFRSRSPIGSGQGSGLTLRGLGNTDGEEDHTQTEAEIAAHNHPPTAGTQFWNRAASGLDVSLTFAGGDTDAARDDTGNAGSGTAFNVVHPVLAVNFIIKT